MGSPKVEFPGGAAGVLALPVSPRNRLSADLAHNYQASPFTTGGTADDPDFWSGKCLSYDDPATSTFWPRPSADQPVDESTEYSASWKFKALDWSKITSVRLSIQWLDSGSSSLGTVNGPVITGPTETTVLELTATSPAGAVEARIYGTVIASAAVEWRMGEMMFCEGDDPTFRPSWNVVGNLRMAARYHPDAAIPPATVYLAYTISGYDGWQFYHATGGTLVARYGNGSSNRGESDPSMNPVAGETHTYEVHYNVTTGAVVWTLDGVDVGTDTCPTGPGTFPDRSPYVGNRIAGYLEWFRAYDDDLLVVDFDAQDCLEAVR